MCVVQLFFPYLTINMRHIFALQDGTRYYKVRWVKYSWEPAASFTHLEHLIREFWNQFGQTPESLQNVANKVHVHVYNDRNLF